MSDKPYFHDSSISVSNATRWKLTRIVNGQTEVHGTHVTVNSLADDILKQWITANHPELNEIWNEREALDDKALARVKERATF